MGIGLGGETDQGLLEADCGLNGYADSRPSGKCGQLGRVFREGSPKSCPLPPVIASCGHAVAQEPQSRDDGNLENDDGCSDQCSIEPPSAFCDHGSINRADQCDLGTCTEMSACFGNPCASRSEGRALCRGNNDDVQSTATSNTGDDPRGSCLVDCTLPQGETQGLWGQQLESTGTDHRPDQAVRRDVTARREDGTVHRGPFEVSVVQAVTKMKLA